MGSRILAVVGRRIRSARLGAGITLAALAVKTELSESTLSRLERGKLQSVRLTHVETIAAAIGISAHSLLCEERPPKVRSESPTVRIRPLLPPRKRGGR